MFYKSIGNENLADVSIPSLFFDLYLATATGDQIKVYLLGYKSAFLYNGSRDDGMDNSSIAMALGISKSDVEKAWEYWEKIGVVKITKTEEMYGVKFLDIKYNYLKKHYKTDLQEAKEENEIDGDNLFIDIEGLIGRPLVPQEKMKLFDAIKQYSTSNEMVIEAFKTSINETGKIKSISYIASIMKSWYDNSIKNKEDLKVYIEERKEKSVNYKRIFSSLGFNRMPTEAEKETINKWIDNYKMPMDVILKACDKSVNISNPSIKYFDSIITSWYNSGIKTVDDVAENEKQHQKVKKYTSKNNTVKTKFHNFEQSKSDKYSKENLRKILMSGIPNPDKKEE